MQPCQEITYRRHHSHLHDMMNNAEMAWLSLTCLVTVSTVTYKCDAFNDEMDPCSADETYLGYAGAAVPRYPSSGPGGRWLMQGWLCHSRCNPCTDQSTYDLVRFLVGPHEVLPERDR
eukprot:scaffold113805_cov16-Prasinocladus_malaysianus.AAC.1